MTDAALSATEPELVLPVPPVEATAAADTEPETEDTRTARQRILDNFEDTEGDQSVVQIMQGTGLSRNAVDSTLSRMVDRDLVLRVAQGVYRPAPQKAAPEQLPTPAETPRGDGVTPAQWLEWLWAWDRGEVWAGPGNPPDKIDGIMTVGCLVPLDLWMAFKGERDALEKQQVEDDALREQLLAAANGNVIQGARLRDLRAVRTMLASGIDLDRIERVIRAKHDRRSFPGNPPLTSWCDLLRPVAESYARGVVAPRMVERWQARLADPNATTAQSPTVRRAMSEIVSGQPVDYSDAVAAHPAAGRPITPEGNALA